MKKAVRPIISFFLAIGIYLIILFVQGVLPFGDNTLLVWDMDWQFSSFYSWYSEAIRGNTPFTYSLYGGLGENMLGLFAYYLSSPINLLLAFFDVSSMPYAVFLILTVKVGLSALTMAIYLEFHRRDWFSVFFSCFYGLSSFALAFQYNSMWMDAVILLPLIVLGIEQNIKNGKVMLFLWTLSLCVFANYYIAYMVCIFCVVYYLAYYYTEGQKFNLKKHAVFFGIMALSLCICAVVLLPTVYVLKGSSADRIIGLGDIFNLNFQINPIMVFKYFYAGAFDSGQGITGEYPAIYAGALSFVLAIAFFISKAIPMKRKVCSAIVLTILFAGMVFRGPFLVWHGMAAPSGCPERFAFLWVFMMIIMAYEMLGALSKEDNKAILIAMSVELVAFIIIALYYGIRIAYLMNIVFSICGIVLYCIYRNGNAIRRFAALGGALLLCILELSYNGIKLHQEQFGDLYYSMDEYQRNISDVKVVRDLLDTKEDAYSYRTAFFNGLGNSYNKGFNYQFNGTGIYCSTENTATWNIYDVLALGRPPMESDADYDCFSLVLVSDLLGFKYIVGEERDYDGFVKVGNLDNTSIYKNDDALQLLLPVNDKIFMVEEQDDLFDRMTLLLNSLGEESEFELFEDRLVDDNALSELQDWQKKKLPRLFYIGDGKVSDGHLVAYENEDVVKNKIQSVSNVIKDMHLSWNAIIFNVSIKSEKYLCSSIAYDKGWSVYVDGAKVEPEIALGGLMVIPVSEGDHVIRMSFYPQGFVLGVLISLITLLVAIIICVWEKKHVREAL